MRRLKQNQQPIMVRDKMRKEYHEQAIFAILEEAKKPAKYRKYSLETLEELLETEWRFLKEHEEEEKKSKTTPPFYGENMARKKNNKVFRMDDDLAIIFRSKTRQVTLDWCKREASQKKYAVHKI